MNKFDVTDGTTAPRMTPEHHQSQGFSLRLNPTTDRQGMVHPGKNESNQM